MLLWWLGSTPGLDISILRITQRGIASILFWKQAHIKTKEGEGHNKVFWWSGILVLNIPEDFDRTDEAFNDLAVTHCWLDDITITEF